jgi:hypothetical protein
MAARTYQNLATVMQRLTDFLQRIVVIAQGAIVLSLLIIIAAVSPMMIEVAKDYYDELNPVWTKMRATDVKLSDEVITMSIQGTKSRDCRYLRIYALSEHATGYVTAEIRRTDHAIVGATRPLGFQHMGVWEIKPVLPAALSVSIFVEHECDSRLVLSKMLNVKVPR